MLREQLNWLTINFPTFKQRVQRFTRIRDLFPQIDVNPVDFLQVRLINMSEDDDTRQLNIQIVTLGRDKCSIVEMIVEMRIVTTGIGRLCLLFRLTASMAIVVRHSLARHLHRAGMQIYMQARREQAKK